MSWSYLGTYILGLKLNKLNFGMNEAKQKGPDTQIDQAIQSL